MKITKYISLLFIAICMTVATGALVAQAEETSVPAVGAPSGITPQPPVPAVGAPSGATIQPSIQPGEENRSGSGKSTDRGARRVADLKTRAEVNKDLRNVRLDMKKDAMEARKEMVAERRDEMKEIHASSTAMFKQNKEMRKEITKKMKAREFEVRKNALVKELELSLTNLSNISERIGSRITKVESEGKATLTDAKALLVIANDKLTKAKADVLAFKELPIPTAQTASSTPDIELAKPRQLGDTAIKSVKDARDAFQKVVASIAKSMGTNTTSTQN